MNHPAASGEVSDKELPFSCAASREECTRRRFKFAPGGSRPDYTFATGNVPTEPSTTCTFGRKTQPCKPLSSTKIQALLRLNFRILNVSNWLITPIFPPVRLLGKSRTNNGTRAVPRTSV